jgi:hypothetical protein
LSSEDIRITTNCIGSGAPGGEAAFEDWVNMRENKFRLGTRRSNTSTEERQELEGEKKHLTLMPSLTQSA